MIVGANTQFADAASVIHATGTILVGDVIDLGKTSPGDLGQQEDAYLILMAEDDIIAAAAGTIQFKLVSDAQAAIATDGTATEHFLTHNFVTNTAGNQDIKKGDLVACICLPVGGDVTPYERYLGILATIGTSAVTGGSISAFLSPDKHGWKPNAAGI